MRVWVLATTMVAAASCSYDGEPITCGPGTHALEGACVPDARCEPGTVFDPTAGGCVLDPSACGPGTVLVGGECVPADEVVADLEEAPEPNDATEAGRFDVPAIGDAITIHGCIAPVGDVPDVDRWIVTTEGPALLEITAAGLGGLAAAFVMTDASEHAKLVRWRRVGLSFAGDTSKRQLFLPVAGRYALVMNDARAILLGEAAGSADACYLGTVRRLALPAPTPIAVETASQIAGTDSGEVEVFRIDAIADGDIVTIREPVPGGDGWLGSFAVLREGVFEGVATDTFVGCQGRCARFTAGDLRTTNDQLVIVVDSEENRALSPHPYTLDVTRIPGVALPVDGTPIEMIRRDGPSFLYFDITTPGQIVHLAATAPGFELAIARRDIFEHVPFVVPDRLVAPTFDLDGRYVRFAQPGRYYLEVNDGGTPGTPYTLDVTLTTMPVAPITYGTPMPGQALALQGSTFYALDVQAVHEWIELGIAAPKNWGAGDLARIDLYELDPAREGVLDRDYLAIQTVDEPPDGSANRGRIVHGDPRDYLVRISSTGPVGSDQSFTLDIKERPHLTLDNPTFDVAESRPGTVAVGGGLRVLVVGAPAHDVDLAVAPVAGDIALELLATDESTLTRIDAGLAGGTESMRRTLGIGRLALSVVNLSASATDVVSSVTVRSTSYTVSPAALVYADICDGGTVHVDGFDDFVVDVALPAEFASFRLFGQPISGIAQISTNGHASLSPVTVFLPALDNQLLPDGLAPNGTLAAYWDDLADVVVCTRADPATHTFTVQWSGTVFGRTGSIEVHAILHADTSEIDYVYGPNHTFAGDEATVGIESLDNTRGMNLVFDEAALVPNSSWRWSPN